MGKLTISMAIFHSYVTNYEGISMGFRHHMRLFMGVQFPQLQRLVADGLKARKNPPSGSGENKHIVPTHQECDPFFCVTGIDKSLVRFDFFC